ncbi:MAG: hypothetical protein ACJ0BT_02240 [Pseudohongiellaceae bacterium]
MESSHLTDEVQVETSIAKLGSGYAELEGSIINYEYKGFGGFYLKLHDGTVKWQGFSGAFKDIVRVVYPKVSKIGENIYFLSWETHPENGDNVVYNFNNMTVYAHLGGGDSFTHISGEIYYHNTLECIEPVGEPMEIEEVMDLLTVNAEKASMTLEQALAGQTGPADEKGKNLLSGKTIQYQTPEGKVSISIDGDITTVKVGNDASETHLTHTTIVADGIYFISWGGNYSGNHIVFNSFSMKVYKQILPDGSRQEAIYGAILFTDTDSV